MKGKANTNLVLLIVLIALTLGAVLVKVFGSNRFEGTESANANQSMFDSVKKENISKITVVGPEDKKAELQKNDNQWMVVSEGNYAADETKVNSAIDALVGLTQGRTVSRKPSSLDKYDLVGSKSIRVTAFDASGSAVADLVIGKRAEDFDSVYVKRPNEESVRRVSDSSLRTDFEPTGTTPTWRNKSILNEGKEEDVEKIEIVGPKGAVVLQKFERDAEEPQPETTTDAKTAEDGAEKKKEIYWKIMQPIEGVATEWQASSMAKTFIKLDCDDFYGSDKSAKDLGLDPPVWTLTATLKGKSEPVVIHMGEKDSDKKYPVKLANRDTLWRIAEYRGDYFTKAPEDYLQDKPKPEEFKEEAQPSTGDETDQSAETPADPPVPSDPDQDDGEKVPAKDEDGDGG